MFLGVWGESVINVVFDNGFVSAVVYDHVTKVFGRVVAVEDVCLEVPEGRIVVLVGPNGAGKTTMLRLAAGILVPDGGRVLVHGFDALDVKAKRRVGFMTPMDRGVYWRLTAMDNLVFFGTLYGLSLREARARARELLDELGLSNRASDWVATYSTGMMRRLEIARALMHDPDVLLLDEPTSGIDVDAKHNILSFIRSLRGRKTVILASHDPQEIELADMVVYINRRILNEAPALKVVKVLVKGSVDGLGGFNVERVGGDEYVVVTTMDRFNELMSRLAMYDGRVRVLDIDVEVAVAEGNARRMERIMRRRREGWL
ncbi:ABC transporter ATP-binding protein [Vulcanisaeta sp. JCM 14467]|uniref:ABC transporter ATP-binding protein n=1 Tax=Vulcanisaeta sp. JCM 14467 TaxID=1295370 RepID=UPI000A75CD6F|nr:ABC transporter ATP-binding protein [Vulcanisaeta sp. JCM 14467]